MKVTALKGFTHYALGNVEQGQRLECDPKQAGSLIEIGCIKEDSPEEPETKIKKASVNQTGKTKA